MCITYVRNRQTGRSAGKLYLVKECCHSSRTICGQPERALYVYVTSKNCLSQNNKVTLLVPAEL